MRARGAAEAAVIRVTRRARIAACVLPLALAAPMTAQTPEQLQAFHDRASSLIAQMASRPMTPGDTFLTFSPEPGSLIHSVRVDSGLVESTLLRGDRMEGTARVEWQGARVSRFEVVWTRADTLRGSGVDSAICVRGQVDGDSIRISSPTPRTLAAPSLPWAVADFGMEEQLIPLFRTLPAGVPAQPVALLRPYHVRWDTVTVAVRDSAGLRVAATFGRDKAREVWVIDQDGRLLYVRRVDQPGDRLPLPNSERYAEMRRWADTIRALLAPYPPPEARQP